jgi:hypothetical protein
MTIIIIIIKDRQFSIIKIKQKILVFHIYIEQRKEVNKKKEQDII